MQLRCRPQDPLEGCHGIANMYHKLAFKGITRQPGWGPVFGTKGTFLWIKGPLCAIRCYQKQI